MNHWQDKDMLFSRLRGNCECNYIQCASCLHDGDKSKIGLATGHAYSILSVSELDNHRMLKLRNPWGRFEWTGRFSDSDPKLTLGQLTAMALDERDANDGTFWLPYADFQKYFLKVYVSLYSSNWVTRRLAVSWNPNQLCRRLRALRCVVLIWQLGVEWKLQNVGGVSVPYDWRENLSVSYQRRCHKCRQSYQVRA